MYQEKRKKLALKNRAAIKRLIKENKDCLFIFSIYNSSLSAFFARIISLGARLKGRRPAHHTTGICDYEKYRILEISVQDQAKTVSLNRYFSENHKGKIYVHIIKANLNEDLRKKIKESALDFSTNPNSHYDIGGAAASYFGKSSKGNIDKDYFCSYYYIEDLIKKYTNISFQESGNDYTPAELMELLTKPRNSDKVKTVIFKQ